MALHSRWERLQLAAARLREIQLEAEAIYRRFPELDRRPKMNRDRPRPASDHTSTIDWAAKVH
jgi:hypothetical protein